MPISYLNKPFFLILYGFVCEYGIFLKRPIDMMAVTQAMLRVRIANSARRTLALRVGCCFGGLYITLAPPGSSSAVISAVTHDTI